MRIGERQERRGKSQTASVAVRASSFPRSAWEREIPTLRVDGAAKWPQSGQVLRSHAERGNEVRRLSRRGITLVELLITMLIISILAALVLGVAAVAGQTAKEAHTRNMITRLHTLVMEQYDTYKNRRIKLFETQGAIQGIETKINNAFPINVPGYATKRNAALAEARLYALREMILMDMPDRWSDVLLAAVPATPAGAADVKQPLYLAQRTELGNVYARRYVGLTNNINTISGSKNTGEEIKSNQDAECLYMFIMLATGDGEARSLFNERDIGDTDGDGAQEFLDGWGHPISFLRWAPGFRSQIQLNLNVLNDPSITSPADANKAVAADHDPYDVFRAQLLAFRLVPLVYSKGRDGSGGVYDGLQIYGSLSEVVPWKLGTSVTVNPSGNPAATPPVPYLNPPLNPYANKFGTELSVLEPTVYEESNSTDNVHNHLLGKR